LLYTKYIDLYFQAFPAKAVHYITHIQYTLNSPAKILHMFFSHMYIFETFKFANMLFIFKISKLFTRYLFQAR